MLASSLDPDQMPHSVASPHFVADLGLRCFPRSLKK